MAKIAVSSKKDKTKKPEGTGVDAGLLKLKDGRIQKKKSGKKSEVVTGIPSSNIKDALQGSLTKQKSKKNKSSKKSSLLCSELSAIENKENRVLNLSPEGCPENQMENTVVSGSTETVADVDYLKNKEKKGKKSKANGSLDQSAYAESAESISNTEHKKEKKGKKETKRKAKALLDQFASAEESSLTENSPREYKEDTDGQSKHKGKKGKLGRFEKLKVIEETRKKKQQKIDPGGTATTPSSLQDMKISLDDLQPDLDGCTEGLTQSPKNRKSRKLAKKAKNLNKVDSDIDSDYEEAKEDEAVCQSYKNDFGFDKVVDAISEEKNWEEDKLEEQKLQEAANKKKKTERDGTELERTIEVINVHIKTSKKVLLSIFKKFGKVESIRYRNIPVENAGKYKINQIMKNTLDKKRSSMTAFVKFACVEVAKSALAANTTEVCGHHILVRPCVRLTAHQQREELSRGCTIIVGNLPFDTEEESLYKHFESCGGIVNISILRNKMKAIGTAFMEFKTKQAAAAALKLDDTELLRRTIRVSKAVRKVKSNKKQVQSASNTHSPGGVGGNKSGRPFSVNSGANKPFTPYQKKPFQRVPGAAAAIQGPVIGTVKPGSVQSRLSRPDQQPVEAQAAPTPGAFTGNKFDQPQKGAAKLNKKKLTKEEVKKVMLAKKLTGIKKAA